ncbi:MAG: transposase [Nanoarchaeota archaeon]
MRRAASLHGIKWIELNVQSEHVQGTAKIPLTLLPSTELQFLKGLSSKLFFERAENFRKRYPKGHLWSRGKFAVSLGIFQLDERNEYIRNQDKHHGTVWIMEE